MNNGLLTGFLDGVDSNNVVLTIFKESPYTGDVKLLSEIVYKFKYVFEYILRVLKVY